MAVCEILRGTARTRDYIREGEKEGKSLLDAMEDAALEGMQTFDSELKRLIDAGALDEETALSYATNAPNLKLRLSMEKGAHPEDRPSNGTSAPPLMASEMDNLIER
jgi:Tfp pilus assembly ATPase PilU